MLKWRPLDFYCLSYWETVEDRWVYVAMRLTNIEFSFDPRNTYRDCPRGVPRGKQNVVRKRSFAHELLLKNQSLATDIPLYLSGGTRTL